MADKYVLTPQRTGVHARETTTSAKILDFLQGQRRWPEGRVISDSPYEGRDPGKLSGLGGTFLRKKERDVDVANRSERFQTKTDYDRRRNAYVERKWDEVMSRVYESGSDKLIRSYEAVKDSYIQKFLDEFDRLSLLEGERMAQGGIVSLNQMTQPVGYR